MTIPSQLQARLVLARAITADFTVNVGNLAPSHARLVDWREWSLRLNTALSGLILAIDTARTMPTGAEPDLSAVISARDLMTVLGALSDAAGHRMINGDQVTSMRYRALAIRLGDDR